MQQMQGYDKAVPVLN